MLIDLHESLDAVARILLTAPFWVSAGWKSFEFAGAISEIQQMGLPSPRLIAVTTIALQSICSVGIIFDIATAYCALGLIAFTSLASVKAHAFWLSAGSTRQKQATAFFANMGLIGGLLVLLSSVSSST